jgi:hypothetical protein
MHARVLILALLGALALLGVALPAHAATPDATPPLTVVTHNVAGTSASRERALLAYWTPQRMRDAIPMTITATATAPKSAAPTLPKATATATTGRRILAQPTAAKGLSPSPNAARPAALSTSTSQGKVFFVDPGTNTAYECSGGTINNPTGDMVITAGHCVYDNGRWMTDWIYVPAYYNGPTRYGTWFSSQMTTFPQWTLDSNPNYDFAIVNVAPSSTGATLVATAGGNGLEYDESYVQNVVIWGYPGGILIPYYCVATTFEQNAGEVGAPCNLPNGVSGGPWLDDYNTATGEGYAFGVNSFGTSSDIYSPYFTSSMDGLYTETADD